MIFCVCYWQQAKMKPFLYVNLSIFLWIKISNEILKRPQFEIWIFKNLSFKIHIDFKIFIITVFATKKSFVFLLNTRKKGKVSFHFWFYICLKIISCFKMLFFMPIFTRFMLVSPYETRLHSVRIGCYLNVTLCNVLQHWVIILDSQIFTLC